MNIQIPPNATDIAILISVGVILIVFLIILAVMFGMAASAGGYDEEHGMK